MKKVFLMAAAAMMFCAGTYAQSNTTSTVKNVLGNIFNSAKSSTSSTITDAISSVIGSGKLTKSNLVGTWKYSNPGCAFTSENLLAKAGGEVAAKTVENKLKTYYNKVGIKSSNTYFTFKSDGTFSSKIDGKSWSGTYTYNESTNAITLKGALLSISGYATKSSTSGISLLFESKKLLTLLQTLSSLSGNTTLSTLGTLSKNYNGVRMGFDLKK